MSESYGSKIESAEVMLAGIKSRKEKRKRERKMKEQIFVRDFKILCLAPMPL